ncbi:MULTISPECIES: tryptophan 2,3-dioxygenase family protein [unclassified Micromonospora]|uniref:tryptophan 2,3-dioxygenase family protein n=1 Tax=unclassified Micromonospora TaxID=2617518 RepID=UPI00103317EC|nr:MULTISPECIES: tryptophan 2,3-dioxygenase family protein [unclassified Micromonospora]QKW14246.1 tryptophan 2,3-dioxygenase [Verrucosispora sp. NA02020]TBL35933.1 tryptophan 2,3-dioxygenase [Verrucosispora sp. SN26_14.1]
MKRDQSPVLPGDGATDYARYMRTEALLGLQRAPEEMIHRDELLFQVVHQSTELWLKLAAAELVESVARVDAGEMVAAETLLGRASLGVRLVTDQLEMLRHLSPADFQAMQPALGNGSGAESPGWRQVQTLSRRLGRAFHDHLDARGIAPAALPDLDPTDPTHRLAEAMVEWDERVASWRVRHYQVALRIGGHPPAGTPGSPANMLAKLVGHRFFPELWQVRLHTPDAESVALH